MSIKWFSLTIAAMTVFFFMFVVNAAMAQDGYLIYQGPTDSQCYTKPTKKMYKKARVNKVRKAAKVRRAPRACDIAAPADSLYDRPEYPGYVANRFAQNPEGYSGYVNEAGMPTGRVGQKDYTDVHIGHRRDIMPDQSGDNADLLTNIMPGYMRTRQIDVIGRDMFVFVSGMDVPKRYYIDYQPNDRIIIRDRKGHKAGNGMITMNAGGDGATIALMTQGTTVPLEINRYLVTNVNHTTPGRASRWK